MNDPPEPLLKCQNVSKRFGGELALDNVDFELRAGTVHGLVGSNGAGKSTLMKILAGALPDHEGTIALDGQPVRLTSPVAAMELGIAMVYQELSGIGQLSVAENLFLGRQPVKGPLRRIDWRTIYRQAKTHLDELQIEVDVHRRLDSYPLVIQQMVEIARGLHSGARILILDEPTSALSPPEVRRLFQLIEQLKQRNVAMIFISHFIEDVLEICDDVTILRDGRKVATRPASEIDKHAIIHAMLGHSLEGKEIGYEAGVTLPPRTNTPPALEVNSLSQGRTFQEVSLQAAPGECLGLYGFVGAGHQELLHALAGNLTADSGGVFLDGQRLPTGNVSAAVKRGVVLVAADRTTTLVRSFPLYQNITMAHLTRSMGNWILRKREISIARPWLHEVGCRPPNPLLQAGQLSGGNQQKVVLAKWLLGDIRVLLLEEPTRGMDVGAKEEIMALIARLREQGVAVILASTEPEMILAHCDRILTMSRGRIIQEFADGPVDKQQLMKAAERSAQMNSDEQVVALDRANPL